jgi:hypothetical protein
MFVRAFRGEWLKRKRSFASAVIAGGSLFTPAVVAVVRLMHPQSLPALYSAETFWTSMNRSCWESMAVFFLPMAAILVTSLVTQIEFRSDAWKQVHALPVSAAVIFLSKLAVILVLMVEFLLLFNGGIYVSAMIPPLLIASVPHPKGTFASLPLLADNARYFLECLPIVAAQYLMALRSSNVLVPIGVGFVAWVGALAAVSSKLAIWWPYAYTTIHYIQKTPKGAHFAAASGLPWLAASAFALLTLIAYGSFVSRSEKG